MSKSILVTGATGKQGGALISALFSRPSPTSLPIKIYALTRNLQSPSAQRLIKTYPTVNLVQGGDFSKPSEIFSQIPSVSSLFLMTNPMNAKCEEQQGKAMLHAAVHAGVSHVIFTATDRGRDSDSDPTTVPHFASKYNIERDIIEHSGDGKLNYTFLRPVAFYENLTDDFLGRAFVGMWGLNGEHSKLQLVGTSDIGRIAVKAVLDDEGIYKNKAMSIVGDEMSLEEMKGIFREVVRTEVRSTSALTARGLKWILKEQVGYMFDWFDEVGFAADVKQMKTDHPFMKDFRTWLREDSAWRTEAR